MLGDADLRPLYDLFGESATTKAKDELTGDTLIGALSFYGIWATLTYLFTLRTTARDARSWAFAGGLLLFIFEMNLKFGDAELPARFFPTMTVFEITKVFHSLYPIFMNGCIAIGGYYHRDIAQENFALGIELLKSNRGQPQ